MKNTSVVTFKHGVHPDEKKDLSQDLPLRDVFPKSGTVVIPITMGGAPNAPLVKVGDEVKCGQIIANGEKFMNCPVHASISGKVTKIATHFSTPNVMVPSIYIKAETPPDPKNPDEVLMEPLDVFATDSKSALARVHDAGIVGMGGASFPTHVKLSVPAGKSVDHIIINAAECEPYLTCDERMLQEHPMRVVTGLATVCQIIKLQTNVPPVGVIALEENKSYIFDILTKAIEQYCKEHSAASAFNMKVQLLATKYPQGSEKFIISAVTGREIPSAKLPSDAGCVVVNVGTACAIHDAFLKGKALTHRSLTISGEGVDRPCCVRVPIGTIVSELTPELFNIRGNCAKVISGGPMMGFAMSSADFPVAKGTSGVTFLMDDVTTGTGVPMYHKVQPCIGCAKCVDACPMRLYPVLISRALKIGDYTKARKVGLMDCIECGCCAFTCPANQPLVQEFRLAKRVVRAQMMAKK